MAKDATKSILAALVGAVVGAAATYGVIGGGVSDTTADLSETVMSNMSETQNVIPVLAYDADSKEYYLTDPEFIHDPAPELPVDAEGEKLAEEDASAQASFTSPVFEGGNEAIFPYLKEHAKYPLRAEERCVEGRVYVSYCIDEEGNVCDVAVVRSSDDDLNQAAVDLVSSLPKWTPATCHGKPIKVRMFIPVTYTLDK